MNICIQQQGEALIVEIEGRVDGTSSRQLHDEIKAAVKPEHQILLLDFKACTYISSASLRVILLLTRICQKQGSELSVCSVPESIEEIFTISGFNQIIPIHPTREEAMSSLEACSESAICHGG